MVEMQGEENKERLPLGSSETEEKQKVLARIKKCFKKHKLFYMGLSLLTLTSLITVPYFMLQSMLYPPFMMWFPFNSVSIPIDLSRAGNFAETKLHIPVEQRYRFSLKFESTQGSALHRNDLLTVFGYPHWDPKVDLNFPIRIKIVQLQDKEQIPIIDQIYMIYGRYQLSASVYTVISLQPGEYTVLVETIDAFPELIQTHEILKIEYNYRKA